MTQGYWNGSCQIPPPSPVPFKLESSSGSSSSSSGGSSPSPPPPRLTNFNFFLLAAARRLIVKSNCFPLKKYKLQWNQPPFYAKFATANFPHCKFHFYGLENLEKVKIKDSAIWICFTKIAVSRKLLVLEGQLRLLNHRNAILYNIF